MFKRRNLQPVFHRLGNLIWPRTGWARALRYLWHRIARLRGTPHSIAAGIASGAATSFTPFIGLHFVLAALTGFLTRGNFIASMIGTGAGNPWTFPLIWVWIYHLGLKMAGGDDTAVGDPDFIGLFIGLPAFLVKALVSFEVDADYFQTLWAIWWPMLLGSIPTFLMVWLATYLLLKPVLAAYQTQRIARRGRRRRKIRQARARIPASGELSLAVKTGAQPDKELDG